MYTCTSVVSGFQSHLIYNPFFFFDDKDWIQGFIHVRQAPYHLATPLGPEIFYFYQRSIYNSRSRARKSHSCETEARSFVLKCMLGFHGNLTHWTWDCPWSRLLQLLQGICCILGFLPKKVNASCILLFIFLCGHSPISAWRCPHFKTHQTKQIFLS
jgi:hypothetical protein